MKEFKAFAKRRAKKQMIAGAVFPAVLIAGLKYPMLGYFIPICMLLGLGIAFFKARNWCDWLCPRGSFMDAYIGSVSSQPACRPAGREIPAFFKNIAFRIGVLLFLMYMMISQIIARWPSASGIGMFFVALLTITTAIGLLLAFIYHPRTWCCFCPIGTMSNWAGRWKLPLVIDSKLCTGCGLCRKVCPIQVSPMNFRNIGREIVKDGDCLKCGTCVSACPKNALKITKGIEE